MGKRLYVGNLPYDANDAALLAAFAQDGRKVERVHIVLDRETGRPRGFAFVEMASEDDAKKAIVAMDGASFGGRNLRVNEAEDRRPGGPGGPGPRGPRPGGGPPSDRAGPPRTRPQFTSGAPGGGGGGGGGWSGGGGSDSARGDDRKKYGKGGRRKHDSEEDFDGPRRGRRPADEDDDDEWQ